MILQLWAKEETNRKTILFVTHDVDEAILLANRIFVFGANPGRILYSYKFKEGEKPSFDDIFEDPDIGMLRNKLIQTLNRDIAHRI